MFQYYLCGFRASSSLGAGNFCLDHDDSLADGWMNGGRDEGGFLVITPIHPLCWVFLSCLSEDEQPSLSVDAGNCGLSSKNAATAMDDILLVLLHQEAN